MSDSARPHRQQPTRLPRPWDSPGKNTGMGCHFLLQCMKVKSESKATQSCPTRSDPMDRSLPGFSVHGIVQARVLGWGAIALSISAVSEAFLPNLACVVGQLGPLYIKENVHIKNNCDDMFSHIERYKVFNIF